MAKKKPRGEGRLAEKPQTSEQKLPGQPKLPFGQKKKVTCHLDGVSAKPKSPDEARRKRGPKCFANGWTCCSLLESE